MERLAQHRSLTPGRSDGPSCRSSQVAEPQALGVDILICGGMDRVTQEWFERRKVRLITNIVGDVQEVLSGIMGLRERQVELAPTTE